MHFNLAFFGKLFWLLNLSFFSYERHAVNVERCKSPTKFHSGRVFGNHKVHLFRNREVHIAVCHDHVSVLLL